MLISEEQRDNTWCGRRVEKNILGGEDYICKGDMKNYFQQSVVVFNPQAENYIDCKKGENNLHLVKRSIPNKYVWI